MRCLPSAAAFQPGSSAARQQRRTSWRSPRPPAGPQEPACPRPSAGDALLWLAFSALGSVMLLASTSHITQNIASVPFLWVLPLSLYLLTFVIAFEGRGGRGWYEQNWWLFVTLVLIVGMAAGLSAARGVLDVAVAVPLYTIGLFLSALFCNGELAHRKPAPQYLTQFYLTISLGGALGGLFVGLVAPRIFPAYFELPLALVLLAALAVLVARRNCWLIGPAIVDRARDRLVRRRVSRLRPQRCRLHAAQLLRHAARARAGLRRMAGAAPAARRDPARRAVHDQCRPARARYLLCAQLRRRPRDRGQAGGWAGPNRRRRPRRRHACGLWPLR